MPRGGSNVALEIHDELVSISSDEKLGLQVVLICVESVKRLPKAGCGCALEAVKTSVPIIP